MAEKITSVFETLNKVNVNDKTEKKGNLTYLSWAWAFGEVKKHFPDMNYQVYERETQYGPVNYFTDGKTCWTKVGVTINGQEHIEMLPVMDFSNRSIPLERITSTDVNKAIQDMNRFINEGKESYNAEIPKAKGEADRQIQVADGYASERVNRAKVDVARFNSVYDEYVKAPAVTRERLYLEAMEEIFTAQNNTLIDGKLDNVVPFKNLTETR